MRVLLQVNRYRLFNQRKNKRFNYRPRFSESESQESNRKFEEEWDKLRGTTQRRTKRFTSLPAMILMLIAVLILMYILNGYMS